MFLLAFSLLHLAVVRDQYSLLKALLPRLKREGLISEIINARNVQNQVNYVIQLFVVGKIPLIFAMNIHTGSLILQFGACLYDDSYMNMKCRQIIDCVVSET